MTTLGRLLVALGIDSRDYDQGLDGAANRASSFGNRVTASFSKLGDVLATTTKVGLLGLAGGFAAFTASGLGMNNTMEQVTAKLNAFTKDGAKTAEILEMIRVRAAKTPFEFDAMAESAAALLPVSKASGIGLEQLIEKAEILAASNPAEGLEGAAFALKEAAGGDMASIIERFNLPRQRLNELKAQGVPAIEAVGIAMKELGLDTDLVTNLANTASGRWSTFKDTFVGVAAKVTQPIFDMASGGLAKINTLIEQSTPQIEAFATSIAGKLGVALNWVATVAVPALISGWERAQPIIATVIDAIGVAITWVSDTAIPTMIDVWNNNLYPVLKMVGDFINDNIVPIIAGLAAAFVTSLVPAIVGFATAATPAIVGFLAVTLPGLISLMAPVLLIGGAIALLTKAWIEDWGGIQGKTQEVIEYLRPHFENLVAWLKEYIPVAIEAAKRFFVTVLVPAFNTVVAYVNANVIPVLKQIFEWLKTNVPIAIAAATDFFNNKLVPAFKAAYDFIANTLIPIIIKLIENNIKILTNVVRLAGEMWTNVLVPAFEAAYKYVNDNIIPVLKRVGDYLSVTFGPIIKTISDFISDQWVKAFGSAKEAINPVEKAINAVVKAIEGALNWIQRMIDKLDDIHIPPILQQHSPSPLEQSIISVAERATQTVSPIQSLQNALNGLEIPSSIDELSNAMGSLASGISGYASQIGNSMQGIASAIGSAMASGARSLASGLGSISIPPVLQQQSPSPLEQSILDVGTALQKAASGTVDFNHNVNNVKMPHTTGSSDNRSIQINIDARGQEQDLVNKIKNVVKDVIQGDVNSASLSIRMSST